MTASTSITFPQLLQAVCWALTVGIDHNGREARAVNNGSVTITFDGGRCVGAQSRLSTDPHKHFPDMDFDEIGACAHIEEHVVEVLQASMPAANYPDAEVRVTFANGHVMQESFF